MGGLITIFQSINFMLIIPFQKSTWRKFEKTWICHQWIHTCHELVWQRFTRGKFMESKSWDGKINNYFDDSSRSLTFKKIIRVRYLYLIHSFIISDLVMLIYIHDHSNIYFITIKLYFHLKLIKNEQELNLFTERMQFNRKCYLFNEIEATIY